MADVILTGKQAAFVAEYVANDLLPAESRLPLYLVAVRAGVAERNAAKYATEALAQPKIAEAIAARKRELAQAAAGLDGVTAADVIRQWTTIAVGDPTEVVALRRVNCRHCHGVNFGYQYTDGEYARETAQALQDAQATGAEADLTRFLGGAGFRSNRAPNPDCPECAGEGVEDVHIRDFRKLTEKQRRLIAGVKQGKFGIEVQFRDQDAALKNLAQWLGLLIERKELSGPNGGPVPVANVNYTLPSDPVEASRAYQLLMEGKAV